MTYTEEAKQELSRKVAEKLGIEPFKCKEGYNVQCFADGDPNARLWLHDDWRTIMELCVKHGVSAYHDCMDDMNKIGCVDILNFQLPAVKYSDCASPSEAERIARLLALGEV